MTAPNQGASLGAKSVSVMACGRYSYEPGVFPKILSPESRKPQVNTTPHALVVAAAGESRYQEVIDLVLDSVDSPHTRRAYGRALQDFLSWYEQQPLPKSLNKAIVNRYRTYLRDGLKLSSSSINQRLSAIRKLAVEAGDNELIEHAAANAIRGVKGIKQEGRRSGNWLSFDQAQLLLNAPDTRTLKGLRDRAVLAVLIGCGLRRTEAALLTWTHIQTRDNRPVIIDLVGKRNKMRSVPMAPWVRQALDEWAQSAGIKQAGPNAGRVFRAINKSSVVSGEELSPQSLRDIVVEYATRLGLGALAPHDLRRTFAKLSHKGGAQLEQVQLSLGHSSIKTTEIYLGIEQDFTDAPTDRLNFKI